MTYGMGINTGLRALRTSQLAIQTIGQNVANVNTPGYSRQSVLLSATMPVATLKGFQIGTGVQADTIRRITDESLLSRIRNQHGYFGKSSAQFFRLKEVEGVFGEPGEASISSLLSGFFSATNQLATDPADRALRGGMVQAGQSLAEGLNLTATRLAEVGSNTLQDVRIRTEEINQHAAAIAELNVKIGEIEANGSAANDLRDRRDEHIRMISRLVDTTAIEKSNGSLDVLIGGYLIVSGSRSSDIGPTLDSTGNTIITAEGDSNALTIRGGEIAGLLAVEQGRIPSLMSSLDSLARNMILEVNRIHTTGVPGSGPHSRLRSENALKDVDEDGSYTDELLSEVGLPFDITTGELFISVTDKSTGDITQTKVEINPYTDTVGDLLADINAIDDISAIVDPSGHLLITANSGYGFDFASRLDPSPDPLGTLGGKKASISGSVSGPFNFASTGYPQFNVYVDGNATPTTVQLTSADFSNPAAGTAEEVVTALNSQLGAAATASLVGNRITIQSNTEGSNSVLRIDTSTAGHTTSPLGLASVTDTGHDHGVQIQVRGVYTGDRNTDLHFQVVAPGGTEGQVGVTPGLQVKVYDDQDTLVATLEVGQGYEEGTMLEVADGIEVSFSHGVLSQQAGDTLEMSALNDADTTDVLVALGLNTFFKGNSASNIEVVEGLQDNPAMLCAGLTTASGNGANLSRILDLRKTDLEDLSGANVETFYTNMIGELGFETGRMESLTESEDSLLSYLEESRQAVSGVSLDEEMVEMVKYQQAFQAASRFINTIAELTEVLIGIGG